MTIASFSFPFTYSFAPPAVPAALDTRDLVQTDGTIGNGRFIDPNTGDYILTANGHLQGANGKQIDVYLALATLYNSSDMLNFGNQVLSVKMLNNNTQSLAQSYITQALSTLLANNQILLLSVQASIPRPGNLVVMVNWQDLTTNTSHSTSLTGNQILNIT